MTYFRVINIHAKLPIRGILQTIRYETYDIVYDIETTKILRAKDLSKLASQTLRVAEYIHFM